VKPRDHVLGPQNITVNDCQVFFAVAIVPEGDDLELAKTRGEVSDRLDFHADVMNPETLAIVLNVALDQVIEVRNGCEAGEAWHLGDRFLHDRSFVARARPDTARAR
jgi:hypothetical protein